MNPPQFKVNMFWPYMNDAAVENATNVLKSRQLAQGPKVEEFEALIKTHLKIPFPVTVNSGTSALRLALDCAGVGPGDEVISTAMTCTATSGAILEQYAKIVYADIQYDTGNIDPKDIEHRITPKTKAIMVVHWSGYPCDMDEIMKIAKKHNLPVIEDAAHALGATYKNRPIGTIADYTCFSLQAIKHINTGDGGILAVRDEKNYKLAIRKRWFGIDRNARIPSVLGHGDYDITERGYKYHMNDIAAAIGIGQIPDLSKIVKRRTEIAERYMKELKNVPGVRLLKYKDDRECAWWLFSMHVDRRLDFCKAMISRGVEVSVVHYRNDRYSIYGPRRKDLPNLDKYEQDYISIPLHHKLSDEDVSLVIDSIKKGW